MSDSLSASIQQAMKDAMRSKDKERLGVIRLIMAAIKQREVDERVTLNDEQILAVLDKMVKQRRESITQFKSAGRDDLVSVEENELVVIQSFLPEPLSEEKIAALVEEAISKTQAETIKDMGKVMGIIKPQAQGRADMSVVSKMIKSRLS